MLKRILRDCPLARIVWNHLVEAHNRGNFFISSNNQWFQNNIFNHSIHWSELWANTCYWLWTWRNKQIHEEEFTRPYQEWDFIKKYTQEYQNISTYLPIQPGIKSRNIVEVPVQWNPPMAGWVSLNIDGAVQQTNGIAGCGGILRDEAGNWVWGFAKKIGIASPYSAELWGIYVGLNLAIKKGVRRVEIQVDSQSVANRLEDKQQQGSDSS